ncbi:MAG: divalent-cation tolerance protein CutA [Acidobacteriaceae bacterium]
MVGSLDEAQRIARELVVRRLAACVNIIPNLTSVYRWQGKIEQADEALLLIKTTESRLPALEAAIRELHSYEVPEFLVLSVESGSRPYLAWLLDSVQKTPLSGQ